MMYTAVWALAPSIFGQRPRGQKAAVLAGVSQAMAGTYNTKRIIPVFRVNSGGPIFGPKWCGGLGGTRVLSAWVPGGP